MKRMSAGFYLEIVFLEMEANPYQVLKLALNAIANNDLEVLQEQLYELEFKYKLEEEDSLMLLNMLLMTAMRYQNKEVVLPILESWNNHLPVYEDVSLFNTLLLYPIIDVGALRFVADALVNVSFLEAMDELRLLDGNDQVSIACRRALEVFGPPTREVILTSFANAGGVLDSKQIPVNQDRVNQSVIEFLESLLEEVAEVAPKPEWVKSFQNLDLIDSPESEEVPSEGIIFQLEAPPIPRIPLDLEQEVELLTSGLEASGLELAERERSLEAVRGILKSATPAQKRELLKPVLEQQVLDALQDDVKLFRLLGPANPLFGSDNDQLAFGGCRMLSCAVFDFDEETGDYYDWFESQLCLTCKKKILRRQYSLRMPLEGGGWLGIYCSFPCLRRGVDQYEEDKRRPYLSIRLMVDNIERQIKEYGIQDLKPLGRYINPWLRPGSGLNGNDVMFLSS